MTISFSLLLIIELHYPEPVKANDNPEGMMYGRRTNNYQLVPMSASAL